MLVADGLRVAPAHRSAPPHVTSSGPEAADLAASAGLVLDGEQRLVLDTLLAERADGSWASFEGAVVAARQNMKTASCLAIALFKLFLLQDRLTVWTAHEFSTSIEAFRDMQVLIDRAPHLSRKVKHVNNTNGEEGIELVSGARLIFRARSKRAGRGLSGNTVILDEAFALQDSHMGSLLPTLSAVPHSQVLYASSAGHLQSTVLRGIRDRGRAGGSPSLAYLEWAAPEGGCTADRCDHRLGTPGCALDDEDLWKLANPALGTRLALTAIRAERQALPPGEFARERMGWWDDPPDDGSGAFDLDAWLALADAGAVRGAGQVFAVAAAPDRSWAAVAVAWRRPDGAAQVMLTDYRPGTAWVAGRVAELAGRWGGRVVADTTARGLVPAADEPGATAVAVAHNALATAVEGALVRHGNEPALNTAVRAARWRPAGDSQVLDRKGSADISPLLAAALAVQATSNGPARGGWMVGV